MGPKIVCLAVVCVFLVHNILAAESSKNVTNPIPLKSSQDELFIDDESDNSDDSDTDTDKLDNDNMMLDEDGSGMGPTSKGTGVEDMESSGSGFGPDDEDSQVGRTKNKGKPGIDSDEDEDDIDNDDEDDETNEDNEEFGKDKLSNNQPKIFPTTSTSTSTTTTTTENYDETRTPELPKQKTNVGNIDDINTAPSSKPEIPQTTSTSTVLPPPSNGIDEHPNMPGVYSHPERTSSFFAQPGILAAVIGGAVVGLLCAILVVMFIVYRMRKKDEGSYPLEETKRSPATNPYLKSTHREFYA